MDKQYRDYLLLKKTIELLKVRIVEEYGCANYPYFTTDDFGELLE